MLYSSSLVSPPAHPSPPSLLSPPAPPSPSCPRSPPSPPSPPTSTRAGSISFGSGWLGPLLLLLTLRPLRLRLRLRQLLLLRFCLPRLGPLILFLTLLRLLPRLRLLPSPFLGAVIGHIIVSPVPHLPRVWVSPTPTFLHHHHRRRRHIPFDHPLKRLSALMLPFPPLSSLHPEPVHGTR